MRNPFKKHREHEEEHQDITDLFFDLFIQVANLEAEVRVLREEVHYLIHFAEEAEDLDD